MVPILSYVFLRGRCAKCTGRIDPLHFQIELAAVIIAGTAAAFAPLPQALVWTLFGLQLLLLAVLDLSHYWLPDRLTGLLAISGLLLAHILPQAPPLIDRIIGGGLGLALLGLIAALYERVRGRQAMGAGDPKMLGAIGCWVGWQAVPLLILIAALLGLLWAEAMWLRGKYVSGATVLPFGCLLAVAAVPAMLLAPMM